MKLRAPITTEINADMLDLFFTADLSLRKYFDTSDPTQ